MKNCSDCAAHDLHMHTVRLTIAAAQGKMAECRRLGHVPWKRIEGKHDICLNCLKHGWATISILAEVVEYPQDRAGRTIRTSADSPMDGGVWPVPAVKRGGNLWWLLLLIGLAIGSMALLSWWLGGQGS